MASISDPASESNTGAPHAAPAASIGCLRWAVDLSSSENQLRFDLLLPLLPPDEQQAVQGFVKEADRKRALVSRLLQRACVCSVLGVGWGAVHLERTKGRKPFCANPIRPAGAPNFNFNVSHEGDWVVLVAEPLCLCGVDVCAPQQFRRRSTPLGVEALLDMFKGQLAGSEHALVRRVAHEGGDWEACFQQLWSCKEAFIKARGDGLGFSPLSRAEFTFSPESCDSCEPTSTTASWTGQHDASPTVTLVAALRLDGVPAPEWHFALHALPHGHWVAVARAPPDAAVDAEGGFRASMRQPRLGSEVLQQLYRTSGPPFRVVSLEQVLPAEVMAAGEAHRHYQQQQPSS